MEKLLADVSDDAVRAILLAIAGASQRVCALAGKTGGAVAAGSVNEFGDAQLALDLAAERAITDALRGVESVAVIASEECPEEQFLNEGGSYSVAFDPLDGSSIVGCNWAVGSIFGVWEGKALRDAKGGDMCAAAAAVYGPRCTLWVGARGLEGVLEFTLRDGEWVRTDGVKALRPDVKVFAPANLRAAQDDEGYESLVSFYMKNRYTLRYSGGLVPDVCQIFTRRGGIFASPVSTRSKAKLRVLYEVMPMAYLVECAGGAAVDQHGKRVLDRVVDGCDERLGLCCGTKEEVQRFVVTVCAGKK